MVAAERLQLPAQALDVLAVVHVAGQYVGSGAGGGEHDAASDAPGAPGDQKLLSLQSEFHGPVLSEGVTEAHTQPSTWMFCPVM